MNPRVALTCVFLLLIGSIASADDREKTHPVKPAELLFTIGQADRIEIYEGMPVIGKTGPVEPPMPVYTSESPRDIFELREAIAIEPPRSWFRCACIPPVDIKLSRRGKELGIISVQEDLTIGFSHWSGDARPTDQEKLLRWFDARGIVEPRKGFERLRRIDEEDRAASVRWLDAMPVDLRPLWQKSMEDQQWWSDPASAPRTTAQLLKPTIATEFPDIAQRIRVLLAWFGSGMGPWSGYPSYEDVPARLLLEYEPQELIAALQDRVLTDSELEGAARFFSGYTYGYLFRPKEDKRLIAWLSPQLKKSLLDHAVKSGDQDKIERAHSAFDPN